MPISWRGWSRLCRLSSRNLVRHEWVGPWNLELMQRELWRRASLLQEGGCRGRRYRKEGEAVVVARRKREGRLQLEGYWTGLIGHTLNFLRYYEVRYSKLDRGIPKLQVSSTGACAVINILLRSRAARCMGKIKGPNVSNRRGRLHAGWYADRLCPGGRRAVPSEAERFLPCPFGFPGVIRTGLNLILDGESGIESVSLTGAAL